MLGQFPFSNFEFRTGRVSGFQKRSLLYAFKTSAKLKKPFLPAIQRAA
jgi:hypothetical protein